MGQVYLADDVKHGRQVAIKVLDPDYARLVGSHRFMREIRIAGMLTHPNLVPLYDSGESGGQLFYVMPYVDGENLRERLKRETMLPISQVVQWAEEICDGLAFAHDHGIVHRDIKPENLLIQSERLLIVDFGIARAFDLAAGEYITSEQLVLGTPLYMSPEQASGAKIDSRTDVYSLGCVVYEMLTGEPPFAGVSSQAITARKLTGHYTPVRILRPSVPHAIDLTLSRALAVHPADRFANAREFSRSLQAATTPNPNRLVRWLVGLSVIGAALAVAAVQGLREPRQRERPRIVVGVFENRTGDPSLNPLGFMAADWVTEGFQRTGEVDVVPTVTALAASRQMPTLADTVDLARALSQETGATLVVSGSIYKDQDSLVFQAQLADPEARRLVGAVEPVRASTAQPVEALRQLRTRLMGLLALSMDDRVLKGESPPTYEAYKAFSDGMDFYVRGEYGSALPSFQQAYAADSTFVLPLLYASFCLTNSRTYAAADSVLRIVEKQRQRLNAYDRYWLDYQRAELVGNDSEAIAAIRKAAELSPFSKATYNFAVTAFEARQPFAAESALKRLSPDVGPMRGWLPYWELLTSALHVQGKLREESEAAAETVRRFPRRFTAYGAGLRALAAKHSMTKLERIWQEALLNTHPRRLEVGNLAYEIGSEVAAHGDPSDAMRWFLRAYSAFDGINEDNPVGIQWGMARAAERLGRLKEANKLVERLVSEDSTHRDYYLGFLGTLAARLGDRSRAQGLMRRLASDKRPYALGEPQFQAGRVAAVIGDSLKVSEFLVFALDRGYPYDLEFHRDPAFVRFRGLPIMRQLDARGE